MSPNAELLPFAVPNPAAIAVLWKELEFLASTFAVAALTVAPLSTSARLSEWAIPSETETFVLSPSEGTSVTTSSMLLAWALISTLFTAEITAPFSTVIFAVGEELP